MEQFFPNIIRLVEWTYNNKGENEGALVQSLMPQYYEDKWLYESEEETQPLR